VIPVVVVLAEGLAVVRREHDDRVLVVSAAPQEVERLPEVVVVVPDLAVIESLEVGSEPAGLGRSEGVPRESQEACESLPRREAVEGPVDSRITVLRRRVVGVVGVDRLDEEEEGGVTKTSKSRPKPKYSPAFAFVCRLIEV
jgi:hypothetical protein